MKKLIEEVEPYELTKRKKIYLRLCSSIMSQQLSTKVAEVIYKRFIDLYDGKADLMLTQKIALRAAAEKAAAMAAVAG